MIKTNVLRMHLYGLVELEYMLIISSARTETTLYKLVLYNPISCEYKIFPHSPQDTCIS